MLYMLSRINRPTLLQFNDTERLPLTEFQEPFALITLILAFFVLRHFSRQVLWYFTREAEYVLWFIFFIYVRQFT